MTINLYIKKWFYIKGRASRREYIVRFLTMVFMCCFSSCIVDLYDAQSESKLYILSMVFFMFVLCVVLILSIIQVFFVTHRRLHDLNTSGWWQLITFVPCGQLLMIGLIFYKGTPTTNKYGEPPTN